MDNGKSQAALAEQEKQKLLSLWGKLTPQQQAAILRFIEVMVKK